MTWRSSALYSDTLLLTAGHASVFMMEGTIVEHDMEDSTKTKVNPEQVQRDASSTT
jgi:hypothetical protein